MHDQDKKSREYQELLGRFEIFISAHIQKFNPLHYGLDPDDIAQDIRFKIWRLLLAEKNITNYPAYIKKIVDTSVIDQLRKLRREQSCQKHEKQKRVAEMELFYSRESSARKSLAEQIGEAVESLIDSRRQVVKLYLLNFNIREIALLMSWSPAKTRNLLYRGMSDLRNILKELDTHHDRKR
jgi:DNA-directed RNA polymerase specialized sigma24 family protein